MTTQTTQQPTLASLVPGLADGYHRRAVLRRVLRTSTHLPTLYALLEARGEDPVRVLAEGGWGGWARNHDPADYRGPWRRAAHEGGR